MRSCLYILAFEIFFIKAKQKVGKSKVYRLSIKAMMKTTFFYEVFLFGIGVFVICSTIRWNFGAKFYNVVGGTPTTKLRAP
jgi:hypothetical protein